MRNKIVDALPLLLFTLVLSVFFLVRTLTGAVLPWWGAWGIGICWGSVILNYLIKAELFKQIGGFAITLLAVIILTGALIPKAQVTQFPQMASGWMVHTLEAGWNAVYTGDVVKQYSLKQQLMDYGESLSRLDPFRQGKMILFGLLGFAMAVVYLFPLEPIGLFKRAESSLKPLKTLKSKKRTVYLRRLLMLFAAGALFAFQVELLQVLSPTREVSLWGMIDGSLGLLAGLLLFVPVQFFYTALAEHRRKGSARFNVLGVGVDAVNMSDCLRRFQEIIEGNAPVQSSEFRVQSPADNCQPSTPNCNSSAEKFEVGSLKFGVSDAERFEVGSLKSEVSDAVSTANCQLSTPNCQLSTPNSQPSTPNRHSPVMTSALGVAGIIEARRSPRMQRILNESVLNTPDGMPLVWLGKLFGYRSIERVYGPDLLRDVCAYGADKGWRHFFYGAAPGVVEKLKAALEHKHPQIQIAGVYCPPFRPLTPEEEAGLIAQVAAAKPDVFWIGISTPKQLYFMDQMRGKLDCKIICPVGYAFDVNAGVQIDAPDWVKYAGLQWLHRAIKEPRLWKRYLPDNPRFMFEVMLQLLRCKKYPLFIHERPLHPFTDAEGYPRFPAGVVALSAMSLSGARDRILNWIATGQKHYVNVCTADTMVKCADQPRLAGIVSSAGLAATDGMPLVWLAHRYGFKHATRVYGPDLMLALCAATAEAVDGCSLAIDEKCPGVQCPDSSAAGKRPVSHFFYGATDKVLAQLKANLLEKFPGLQIAGMYSPPFRPLTAGEKADVIERINASGADIVWCGLGTPKQDYWVAEFQPELNAAAVIAVGAAFNFHAGEIPQAPRWMMRSGLEWLFRLGAEPKRLWRRYLIGNPRFILLVGGKLLRGNALHRSDH
ncbi:MAG: WecB/TagA/CpsF family glycosyltransferase [Kiritimatiellales bacterium]